MQLVVESDGTVRCLYGEEIDLSTFGPLAISRGSHVEPTADGCWLADLLPVSGPILGPFQTRSAALAAEVAWLEANWLGARESHESKTESIFQTEPRVADCPTA